MKELEAVPSVEDGVPSIAAGTDAMDRTETGAKVLPETTTQHLGVRPGWCGGMRRGVPGVCRNTIQAVTQVRAICRGVPVLIRELFNIVGIMFVGRSARRPENIIKDSIMLHSGLYEVLMPSEYCPCCRLGGNYNERGTLLPSGTGRVPPGQGHVACVWNTYILYGGDLHGA